MGIFEKPLFCQPHCVSPNASPRAKVEYLGMQVGLFVCRTYRLSLVSKACVCVCDMCMYAGCSHGWMCLCVVQGAYTA